MALCKLGDKTNDKPSQLRQCKMCSHCRVHAKTGLVWLENYIELTKHAV